MKDWDREVMWTLNGHSTSLSRYITIRMCVFALCNNDYLNMLQWCDEWVIIVSYSPKTVI